MQMRCIVKTILVVSDRYSIQDRFRWALVEGGWEVLSCHGPPECDGERTCPLAKDADAVILDTDIDGPIRAWTLLCRYRELGKPIVVLVPHVDLPAWIGDRETLLVEPRDTEPAVVIDALRDALARAESHLVSA
jgi:hypothetical protein